MSKFIKVTLPNTKVRRVKVNENGKDIWYVCSEPVYKFAGTNFKEGDNVELTIDGTDTVVKITKVGGDSSTQTQPSANMGPVCEDCGEALKDSKYKKCWTCNDKKVKSNPAPTGTGFTCADCGDALKDGKYKKCFTCNQKNPVKTGYSKSQEELDGMRIGNLTNATAQIVNGMISALVGQVNRNDITEVVKCYIGEIYPALKEQQEK